MSRRVKPRALAAVPLVVSLTAFADTTITIDGAVGDWAAVTSCVSDPAGDTAITIDLTKACVTNNNSSGVNGSLFAWFQAASTIASADHYMGFTFDVNDNGLVDSADEQWMLHFSLGSTTPDALAVFTPGSVVARRTYVTTGSCGGSGSNDGWSGKKAGQHIEMKVAYGCLGGGFQYGADERRLSFGTFDETAAVYYDGTLDTLTLAQAPPEVKLADAVAGNGAATIRWSNPNSHAGTLVLRSVSTLFLPSLTDHSTYAVGATSNGWVVVSSDDTGASTTFADQGLVNGTRYFYRVYNHHQRHTWSGGNAPSSAGLFVEPTAGRSDGGAAVPVWCASFGYPAMQRPVVSQSTAVFTASNGGTLSANVTSVANAATDGQELWRPVQLSAAVQSRPLLVPLYNRTGNYLVTGDQSGHLYLVRASTGETVWNANAGAALGDALQNQPVAQLYAYADVAFKAAHPGRDLIFIGTHNVSALDNKVYAISSVTGEVVWAYAPGNLDSINGGMLVDYTNNRLFVAARSNGSTQPSVRVLSSLTGALVTSLSLGDIDTGVNLDFQSQQAYLVTNAGMAYGLSLSTLAVVWSANIGATSSWVYPTGNGFIASLSAGAVRRYSVVGATVSQLWSTNVAGPSGVALDYVNQKAYVGGSDGVLRQLRLTDGVAEKSVTIVSQAPKDLGQPQLDTATGRLHFGTMDGRLCAHAVPLP